MAENDVLKKTEEASSAEVAPPTREELVAKLEEVAARAKAAGMSPLQMMARSYADRGLKVLDGFLSALEEPKKPPAEDATKKQA